MRLILIIVILFCFSFVYSQNGISSHPTSPVADFAIDKESNEKIKELYFVLQADKTKRHGKYKAYNTLNVLIKEGQYNKGARQGEWKSFYISSPNNIRCEGSYSGDKKIGKWNYYYQTPPNKLKEERNYSGSTIQVVRFYENGAKKESGQLVVKGNGEYESGSWEHFHPNGRKKAQGTFTYNSGQGKSVKTGKWTYWYQNGTLQLEESYSIGGYLHGKKTYYNTNQEVEKHEYYENGRLSKTENRFSFQKEKIEELLEQTKVYESIQAIYSGEISELKTEFDSFKNAPKKNEENFQKGNEIMSHLKFVIDNYDKVVEMDKKVEKNYNSLVEKYKERLPNITQKVLAPYKKQIDAYFNTGKIKSRLQGGEKILEDVERNEEKCANLYKKDLEVQMLISEIKVGFSTLVPDIYANEEKIINDKVEAYKALSSVDEKNKGADEFLEFLKTTKNNFTKLKTLGTELETSSFIMTGFGDKYKAIHTNLKPLIDKAMVDYTEIKELQVKIDKGESLLNFFKRLEKDYKRIEEQTASIHAKWDDFTQKFENDKENKFIYRKAKIVYNVYLDALAKQAATNSRLSYGRYTIAILDKLLSFYGQDNKELNGKLRSLVNPGEIKDAFGIKEQ